MNPRNFSKSEAVKFGFETVKKNLKFFIILVLIIGLVDFGPSFFINQYLENRNLNFFINIILGIVGTIISIGTIKISLKFVDGAKANLSDLLSSWNNYLMVLKYWASSILYGLIVGVGLLLLIIPGIIWAIKFQFYTYLIVEKNLGPIEALKKSWEVTHGVKWNLFLFGVLLGLINILGFLALIVGLFVSIPTTMLAQAFIFRKLSALSSQEQL